MVIASLVADVPLDDPSSSTSSWPIVVGVVAVVALALVGVGVFLRRRGSGPADE